MARIYTALLVLNINHHKMPMNFSLIIYAQFVVIDGYSCERKVQKNVVGRDLSVFAYLRELYPLLVRNRLSLVFPELSDDIIQDIGVAHRVKHRCGVVHKLASIGAVEYTDGTGLANMQRICQHLDNPCNLSM